MRIYDREELCIRIQDAGTNVIVLRAKIVSKVQGMEVAEKIKEVGPVHIFVKDLDPDFSSKDIIQDIRKGMVTMIYSK